MEFKNLLPAKSRDELRQWLSENYNKEDECWVVVKRGRPIDDGTFWYIDAVEEAMCFGWIDSTTKKMENGVYLELCRRGYNVHVGKSGSGKIDFVAVRQNEKLYVQVTQELQIRLI